MGASSIKSWPWPYGELEIRKKPLRQRLRDSLALWRFMLLCPLASDTPSFPFIRLVITSSTFDWIILSLKEMDQATAKKTLQELIKREDLKNKTCIDCGNPNPQWASVRCGMDSLTLTLDDSLTPVPFLQASPSLSVYNVPDCIEGLAYTSGASRLSELAAGIL